MLGNLERALGSKKITRSQVASVLGYTRYSTISDKLEGKSTFSFDEAVKLKKAFFPEYDLEFLFQKTENKKQPA